MIQLFFILDPTYLKQKLIKWSFKWAKDKRENKIKQHQTVVHVMEINKYHMKICINAFGCSIDSINEHLGSELDLLYHSYCLIPQFGHQTDM